MAMKNNQYIFSERYNQAYQLCKELLSKKLKAKGKETVFMDENLILSILASLPVTDLIMQHNFETSIYKPVLIEAIEETRKELFPDLAKKRFISVEILENTLADPESTPKLEILKHKKHENDLILRGLPEKSKAYIKKIIDANPKGSQHLRFKKNHNLIKKVSLITQLFPNQKVPFVQDYWNTKKLTDAQIINIYKCVLAGIEKNFPANFLKTQARLKTKILIRFLFNKILCISDPQELIAVNKELLNTYKLNNVLRYFNYSVNQLMHNAFPEKFPHWYGGKTIANYWDYRQNRISAIRWMVETKLLIDVANAPKIQLNKRDFSRYGLSYLFNIYYNSTSKALREAYPVLKPWQIGSLPRDYWDPHNIKKAIVWMMDRLGWNIHVLPSKYNNGQITRKTFSQFGLSGLFEKKFNCNIYTLVHFIWPGKFKEWEFGNMPANFWRSAENRKKFAAWFSEKFNINMFNNAPNLESIEEAREYKFYSSLYKYCNGDFNHLLKIYALDIAEQNKNRMLLRKWDNLIKREKETLLEGIILHGFFYNLVKSQKTNIYDRLKRMKIHSMRY